MLLGEAHSAPCAVLSLPTAVVVEGIRRDVDNPLDVGALPQREMVRTGFNQVTLPEEPAFWPRPNRWFESFRRPRMRQSCRHYCPCGYQGEAHSLFLSLFRVLQPCRAGRAPRQCP